MDSTHTRQASDSGLFQCSRCLHTYTRIDHLARHVRSHLQERPFQCETCNKCFGRLDLLKRHARSHDPASSAGKRQKLDNPTSRVSSACAGCAAAKVKCNNEKPCRRCCEAGIRCDFSENPHLTRAPVDHELRAMTGSRGESADSQSPSEDEVRAAHDAVPCPEDHPDQSSSPGHLMTIDQGLERRTPASTLAISQTPNAIAPPASYVLPNNLQHHSAPALVEELDRTMSYSVPPPHNLQEHQLADFLHDVMAPQALTQGNAFDHTQELPSWSGSSNLLDFNMITNLDFDIYDASFLDLLCGRPVAADTLGGLFDGLQHGHTARSSQWQAQQKGKGETQRRPEESQNQGHDQKDHDHEDNTKNMTTLAQRPWLHTRQKAAGVGLEAFQKSYLSRWLPALQDNVQAELSRLPGIGGKAANWPESARCRLDQRRYFRPGDVIQVAARDKLLAMVLSACDGERGSAVAGAFPTSGLLDDLLQNFFSHHCAMPTPFVHVPTFSPGDARAELLGGMVACGAVLSDIRALQKLGFAIQEAVRVMLPRVCENSNAFTRDLWLLQSFLCEVETGLWSGDRRKMELAESHTQTLFTMLRRGGYLRKQHKPPCPPLPQDTGPTLHQKWLEWVSHESYKRLAFYAFMLDARASMSLFVNPLLSYAEMALVLPESLALWMAEDADQWKEIYLRHPERPVEAPSLVHFLRRPLELASLPPCYDLHFSSLIVLHGLWGMIREYTQHSSIRADGTGGGNAGGGNGSNAYVNGSSAGTMALRHQELCQILQHLRMGMMGLERCDELETDEEDDQASWKHAEFQLVHELLSMYLHISLEKVQQFAGKEGLEEARRMLPELQEWATTTMARQAIVHAGQVLHAARAFRPRQLKGFHAIAVYHATLTCWTYGLVSQQPQHKPTATTTKTRAFLSPASLAPDSKVWLDGPETTNAQQHQRFIALGRGTPCLSSTASGADGADRPVLVPLSDVDHVMEMVIGILHNNAALSQTGMRAEALPPLIENLIQLMLDLGRAGTSVAKATL